MTITKIGYSGMMDKGVRKRFKKVCEENGQKMSSVVEMLVINFLRENEAGTYTLINQKKEKDNKDKDSKSSVMSNANS